MRTLPQVKKFAVLISVAAVVSLVSLSNLLAQENDASNALLQQIANNTLNTLNKVDKLPDFMNLVGQEASSWLAPDSSQTTPVLQGIFTTLGNTFNQGVDPALTLQIASTQFGAPGAPLAASSFASDNPAILKTLPNINDLTYSTLLGSPPVPKAPNVGTATTNYILNASGATLVHTMPAKNFTGKTPDIQKYQAYYNTVMAAESFGSYAIASNSNPTLTVPQANLIAQASSGDWFTQIASASLGTVLRQILMFQSQSYILLTQLLQTEKQAVIAQSMTNALLIANNMNTEAYWTSKATGVPLTSQ